MNKVVLPHVTFARELLASDQVDIPFALQRRAQLAALPAVPGESVIEVPAYLVDLGLRRWRDPSNLFSWSLNRNPRWQRRWAVLSSDQGQAFDACVRAWEGGSRSTREVIADLESLIIFTGDDRAALALAGAVTSAVKDVDSPRLAVALATMQSVDDPCEAMRLFDQALALAGNPSSVFLIQLRRVALMIKRLHSFGAARALIKQLWQVADAAYADFVVSQADAAGMHALLLNLRALVEVREEDYVAALATMEAAADIMPEDGFIAVPEDMADRYRAQVRINVVQTLWLTGQVTQALQRINAHVTITRTEHPYSLSEALLVAAYISWLGQEAAMALSYCMEAERLIALEGTPTRLVLCRRVAVAALARLGKTRRAEILARQLAKDPLGDHRLV